MIDRINLLLQAKNVTIKQFAEEIGIQPSGMSHILNGRNNPSLDFVTKVIRRYPEIDANWLLLGRGEMYTAGAQPSAATASPALPFFDDLEPESPAPAPVPVSEPPVQEPTLFDAPEPEPPVAPRPAAAPLPPQPPAEPAPPVEAPPAPEPMAEPQIESILFFYSDGTFRSYRPARSQA